MARDYVKKTFGVAPVGLWPSEGSVSDHVLEIAAAVGFEWAATDNGVLDRTLRRAATPDVTYRPYLWSQRDRQMQHDLPRSRAERPDRLRLFRHGRGRRRAGFSAIASTKTAGAFSAAAATRWCRSFWMAKTRGNTTTTTAGRSSASSTAAFRTTRAWKPSPCSEAFERIAARTARRTSSPAPGSTPTSTSGSAPRKTTNPGGCCSMRARLSTKPRKTSAR